MNKCLCKIIIGFSFLFFFLGLLPCNVLAYTNTYRNIDYGEDADSVREFEELLQSEGYICVTEGYSDNEEWTQTLYEDTSYPYCHYIPQSDYRVYVYPLDYENYEKGETVSLYANTYLCDYYIFNHSNEEGNCTGKVGNQIPEYMDSGYLTIHIDIADEFKQAYPNAIYTIILYGEETGCYYDLSSSMLGDNEYYIRKKVPADKYYVYSAYVSYTYPSDCSNLTNGFKVVQNTENQIEISFCKATLNENIQEITSEQEEENPFGDLISLNPTNDLGGSQEVVEDRIEKVGNIVIYLVLFGLCGLGTYKSWKRRKDYNDEDDE